MPVPVRRSYDYNNLSSNGRTISPLHCFQIDSEPTSLLMLILLLGCYTVWLWAMLRTFRWCILPPSSGSKYVCWRVSLCVYIRCVLKRTGKGEIEWGLLPRPGAPAHLALERAVCTMLLVHCPYWHRQGTNSHFISPLPPPFQT
jgi:hypothetical protein